MGIDTANMAVHYTGDQDCSGVSRLPMKSEELNMLIRNTRDSKFNFRARQEF